MSSSESLKNTIIPSFVYVLATAALVRPIHPNTIGKWHDLMGLIDQVDDDFDCAPLNQKQNVKDSTLQLIREGTGPYSQNTLAKKVRTKIPPSQIDQFTNDLHHQFSVSGELAITTDPAD